MNQKELAALAGVSPAAVSLVLNNKKGVGEEKRRKILQLLKENGYSVPGDASPSGSILLIKYSTHGILVEENAGFVNAIIDSIQAGCLQKGIQLSIRFAKNNLSEALEAINFAHYQGVILLGTELPSSDYKLLEEIPLPSVVVDNEMPGCHCSSVVMDNDAGVRDALEYLFSLGHREIAYFSSSLPIQNFADRSRAFFKAVQELGMTCLPEHHFKLLPSMMGACGSMDSLLKKGASLPSCAFADNDTIAIGAMKSLQKHGIRIPEDISVIGFDDIQYAAIHSPSLSTIRIPREVLGTIALEHLQLSIANPQINGVKSRISGTLIPRRSAICISK